MRLLFLSMFLYSVTAAHAAPMLYNLNFYPTQGAAPASGSFRYDPVNPAFSDFVVLYLGVTMDFTDKANNSQTNSCFRPDGNRALAAFSWLSGDQSTQCGLGTNPDNYTYYVSLTSGNQRLIIDSRQSGNFVFDSPYAGDVRDVDGIAGAGRLSVTQATPEASTSVCLAGGLLALVLASRGRLNRFGTLRAGS